MYEIRLGTVDQTDVDVEWRLRPYLNTAKKWLALSIEGVFYYWDAVSGLVPMFPVYSFYYMCTWESLGMKLQNMAALCTMSCMLSDNETTFGIM